MEDNADADFSKADTPKVSKYNSAIAQLYRIDALWIKAHRSAIGGDLLGWNWVLDRIWCELAANVKDDKVKIFNDFVVEISDIKGKKDILYHVLLRKEIFLRKIQNDQGKGDAYADSIEEYMG